MLVHLLALGLAFHLPAARLPAARSHLRMSESAQEATRITGEPAVGAVSPTKNDPLLKEVTTLKDYLETRSKLTASRLDTIVRKRDSNSRLPVSLPLFPRPLMMLTAGASSNLI